MPNVASPNNSTLLNVSLHVSTHTEPDPTNSDCETSALTNTNTHISHFRNPVSIMALYTEAALRRWRDPGIVWLVSIPELSMQLSGRWQHSSPRFRRTSIQPGRSVFGTPTLLIQPNLLFAQCSNLHPPWDSWQIHEANHPLPPTWGIQPFSDSSLVFAPSECSFPNGAQPLPKLPWLETEPWTQNFENPAGLRPYRIRALCVWREREREPPCLELRPLDVDPRIRGCLIT